MYIVQYMIDTKENKNLNPISCFYNHEIEIISHNGKFDVAC